jgi:hypothetical protein
MEAAEAHAVLRRLGEEAYASKMQVQHVHTSQREHHQAPEPGPQMPPGEDAGIEAFNWSGLMSWLFMVPKFVLGIAVLAGIFLFGIFGWFIFVPLVAFVLLTGPFRQMLKPEQRREMNTFVAPEKGPSQRGLLYQAWAEAIVAFNVALGHMIARVFSASGI